MKGQQNDSFNKMVKDLNLNDKMSFMNYFTCRTQRVQLKFDTETIGKKNFGDLLSKKGASIITNNKKTKKKADEVDHTNLYMEFADNPDKYNKLMSEETDKDNNDPSKAKLENEGNEANKNYMRIVHAEIRDEMMFMLETGLNLVLYGVGSKINFMKKFTQSLKGSPILCINGFHPGITLKTALKELTTFINDNYVKGTKSGLREMKKFFCMHDNIEYLLKTLSLEVLNIPKIYIIIMSLDGGNLKSLELQRHLSLLPRLF
jgi:hypothetical protein